MKVYGLILKGMEYNQKFPFANNYLWVTKKQMQTIMKNQDDHPFHSYWVDNRVFRAQEIIVSQEVDWEEMGKNYPPAPKYLWEAIEKEKSE